MQPEVGVRRLTWIDRWIHRAKIRTVRTSSASWRATPRPSPASSRRWQGPLVNLAYRFCRDRARSEEMAQEAFLRAFRFLDRWRGDAAFSTWLFALATNVYRSQLRRRRIETLTLDEIREPTRSAKPRDGGGGPRIGGEYPPPGRRPTAQVPRGADPLLLHGHGPGRDSPLPGRPPGHAQGAAPSRPRATQDQPLERRSRTGTGGSRMNHDAIDRALGDEREITPSPRLRAAGDALGTRRGGPPPGDAVSLAAPRRRPGGHRRPDPGRRAHRRWRPAGRCVSPRTSSVPGNRPRLALHSAGREPGAGLVVGALRRTLSSRGRPR